MTKLIQIGIVVATLAGCGAVWLAVAPWQRSDVAVVTDGSALNYQGRSRPCTVWRC